MTELFISHSSEDRLVAEQLARALEREHFQSFFLDLDPEHGIPVGRDWEQELYRGLRSCSATLFLCSPAAVRSKWCFAELAIARALGKRILPLRIADCDLPDMLRGVHAIDLRSEADDAYTQLCTELRRIGLAEEVALAWDDMRPPYPGMSSFAEQDAAVFFGRTSASDQLAELVRRMRLIGKRLAIVTGASGCGKSSIVRAGLLPRLRKEHSDWIVLAPMIAGPGLLEELAEQFARESAAGADKVDFEQAYRVIGEAARLDGELEGSGLSSLLRRLRLSTGRHEAVVLWVVDQAERLLADNEAARNAMRLVASCARSVSLPLQVLLTLRSDHLDAFHGSPLFEAAEFETFPVAPLSPARFGECIEGPARRAGLELGPGLVSAMVADASRRDGLPLLAFALRDLWMYRGREQGELTLDDYTTGLGGLAGSVHRRARQVMASLQLSDQALAQLRNTLCRMARISEGGTYLGQPIPWATVPEPARPAIRELVDARLLTLDESGTNVDVAHEILFRAWDELAEWLNQERQFHVWVRRMEMQLQEWEEHDRDIERVYLSGALLSEAVGFAESHGTSLRQAQRDFVEASLERQRKEREAYQISLARHLAAEAQVVIRSEAPELLDRGLLLALEAMRRCIELGASTLEVDQALREALSMAARRTAEYAAEVKVKRAAVNVNARDGSLAFGDADGRTWVWQPGTESLRAGPGLPSSVNVLAFSPDGRWLAAAAVGGELMLMDTQSFESRELECEDVHALASAMVFSDNGQYLATAFGARCWIWDLHSEEPPVVLDADIDAVIVSMTFGQGGAVLVIQPVMRETLVWKWRERTVVGRIDTRGNHVEHSPDGRFLAVSSASSFVALLVDIYQGEQHQLATNCAKLVFSPDGRFVGMASPEHFARIWRLPELTEMYTLRHNAELWDLAFTPDGSRLVTMSKNGVARVWSMETGSEVARVAQRQGLHSPRFFPDSRHLLTHGPDNVLTVWDTVGLQEAGRFEHEVAVLGVAFDPDGRLLATRARASQFDRAAVLIDLASGQPVPTVKDSHGQERSGVEHAEQLLERHKSSSRADVVTSADGNLIARIDGQDKTNVHILHAAGEQEPLCTLHHDARVFAVVFSPDGRHVVTASDHDTGRIWEVATGHEVSRLTHPNPNVTDIDFSPDGRYVATSGWDGTVRIWPWRAADLILAASSRVDRNLSAQEWERYLPGEPYRAQIPET